MVGLFGFFGNNLRSIYRVTWELGSVWEVSRQRRQWPRSCAREPGRQGVNRGSTAYGSVTLVARLKHMKQDLEHGKCSLNDYKWQSTDSYPGLSQRDGTKWLLSPLAVGFIISPILQIRKPRSREVK